LYLNAKNDSLDEERPRNEWRVKYDGLGSGPGRHRAEFDFVFEEESEITGYASAMLFMESPKSEDMHVFITLWKLDRQMEPMGMTYYAQVFSIPHPDIISPPYILRYYDEWADCSMRMDRRIVGG
jgi:uncharacterized protein